MGFRRIYNHGDQPGFAYNMGGRIYAVGGSYQRMPSAERAAITINGEPTVELDIRASHLSIIYAVEGIALDPAHDPYGMAWPPRDVAKAWTTMALGYGDFQKRWSAKTRKTLLRKKGIDVDDYPIAAVRDAMLDKHPILKRWPESKLRWPELQYRESRVIVHAITSLAFNHDVPSLPIHDSLIVPVSKLALVSSTLRHSFKCEFGQMPVLTTKKGGITVVL